MLIAWHIVLEFLNLRQHVWGIGGFGSSLHDNDADDRFHSEQDLNALAKKQNTHVV